METQDSTENKNPLMLLANAGVPEKQALGIQKAIAEQIRIAEFSNSDLKLVELRLMNHIEKLNTKTNNRMEKLNTETNNRIDALEKSIDTKFDGLKKDLTIKLGGLMVTTMFVLSALVGFLSNLDKILK